MRKQRVLHILLPNHALNVNKFLSSTVSTTECFATQQEGKSGKWILNHQLMKLLNHDMRSRLRWIGRKHLNDVAQQVETSGKATIFVAKDNFHIGGYFIP